MSNPLLRLVDLGRCPSWQTQAVYHSLAAGMCEEGPDTIVLCQPDKPYLCLGRFQEFESIFSAGAVHRQKLPVYRRWIGGGATYLNADQLFYQFVFHHSRVPVMLEKIYARLLQAPLKTLKSFGLDARLHSLNELEVNGRRIAGIGGGRINEGCVVVGNFLFDFDYEAMSRVWAVPWEGFRELARLALNERVYTLKQAAPKRTLPEVRQRLKSILSGTFSRPLETGGLSADEWASAECFAEKIRFEVPERQPAETAFGQRSPLKIAAGVFIHHRTLRVDGQKVALSYRTDEDRVTQVRVSEAGLQKEFQTFIDLSRQEMAKRIDGLRVLAPTGRAF